MNTPVSFEIAKLLKEKDIKIDTEEVLFYKDEVNNIKKHQIKNRDVLYNYTGFSNYIPDENEYQTYMISEVVMWLYEKHKIWVSIGGDCDYKFKFEIHTWKWYEPEKSYRLGLTVLGETFWDTASKDYASPTEAYEAAIEYVLENLI